MAYISFALTLLLAAAPAAAAPLAASGAAGFMTPAVADALRDINKAMPKWTPVSVRVSATDENHYRITEPFVGIHMTGSREANGRFLFSGFAGRGMMFLSAMPYSSDPRAGYMLFGSGASLSLRPWGNGWMLSGTAGSKPMNAMINPYGDGYTVWGQGGLSLSAWARGRDLEISGAIEPDQFDAQSLAALATALTVVNAGKP